MKQLKAILWKNYLLKKAHPWSTLAEILLPVFFMALLIFIKLITSVYDSPNVAYYCGNTYPWHYTTSTTSIPLDCLMEPPTCTKDNYYQGGTKIDGVHYYDQYGYVDSGSSSGISSNPFYAYTIGDSSLVYEEMDSDNPSLPLSSILDRMKSASALLALCPNKRDDALMTVIEDIKTYMLNQSSVLYNDTIKIFDSKNDLDNYITNSDYDDKHYKDGKVGMAIMLYEANKDAAQWEYAVRTNFTYDWEVVDETVPCLYGDVNGSDACPDTYNIPSTQIYTQDLFKPQSTSYLYGYTYSGFSTLQLVMDSYIFQLYNPAQRTFVSVGLMPTVKYVTDDFQYVISSVLGIFYMLSFLYPVSRIVRGLVIEKENKIKEGMKMMGLTDFAYNTSWLITTLLQMTLVSLLITLVTATTVFEYSNKFFVFLYFLIFSFAVINMCFLMATFFSRSKVASLMGPMIFFASFFPYYAVSDPSYSSSVKASTCLLAPACFALGANVFADYEGGLVGVQEGNASEETSNFSYALCVSMMMVDAVLYGVLAWYLDKVLPSEFGTQLPLYFPFLPSYWCGTSSTAKADSLSTPLVAADASASAVKMEPVSPELANQVAENKCIQIKHLRKVYETTAEDRVAVKSLDLEIYQNQVTVLLGHNGAGKSTSISMLTGLIPPTSGDAMICGHSVTHSMQAIRSMLGVCPQHDILFPELTVMEHLVMFAEFKGVPSDQVASAAAKMIAEVGLKEKANVRSSMLSGGQKRKLSVGIALIGDSKIIILDEPTSGMDPYSRRSTWNIIQRNKKNRLILLTTHFMDEADILGDRIAIMADGELRCVGSSLFLKKTYGVGYTFTIVKETQGNTSGNIIKTIKSHVADAEILNDVGAEVSFRLPFNATPHFVDLFTSIDAQKAALNIAQYGISVTTLEEVFIRVGRNTENIERSSVIEFAEETSRKRQSSEAMLSTIHESTERGSSIAKEGVAPLAHDASTIETDSTFLVFMKHFRALFIKRFIYGKRDKRLFLCQIVLPVLLVILGLGLLLLEPSFDQPDLVLSPKQYNTNLKEKDRNYVPFNTMEGEYASLIANQFNGDDDMGVYGVSVPIVTQEDQFYNCSVGAHPLHNMSNFLLVHMKPKEEKGSSRYGSVTVDGNTTADTLIYNVLVNGSAVHGAGIYMNLVDEAYLQVLTNNDQAYIKVHNYPLPRTWKQDNNAATADAFTAALFFMIAFCFIPASYVTFIVKEREVKAKHQQIISGVSIYSYWCSTYLWDVVSYFPTLILVVCIIFAFGIDAYTKNDGAGATFLLFLLYGPAVAAFTYSLSFIFRSHSTAQLVIMFANFLTGLCLMVVSFVLTLISSTQEINVHLRYLFRLFPSFCLGDGLTQLALCTNGKECPNIGANGYDYEHMVSPFHWNVVGANLFFLAMEAIVYFVIAVAIEYSLTFPQLLAYLQHVPDAGFNASEAEDEDVAVERRRVAEGGAVGDVVHLKELRKVYPSPIGPKVAVQSLSFGIPRGECFGFLGINGAGKTTTLSILSGEFPPTSGEAYIDGCNIQHDQSKIRRKIGYCPQFDALLELLTVREHLELYGRIKGLHGEALQRVVAGKMKQMDLLDFEHKAAGTLSGGNKRKLSVAIATIAEPSIVFLDEPSTGMDPVARRFMWEVISKISTQDALCSIILTTHSMEEAEALCTRIGIMVNGRLRCLGSAQHLKQRFGNGYELDIKTTHPTATELMRLAQVLADEGVIELLTNIELDESQHSSASGHDTDGSNNDGDLQRLGKIMLSKPLYNICSLLGEPERIHLIAPGKEGATIHDVLEADGVISLRSFLEWWLAEDYAIRLSSFLEREFPGAALLERSSAHSFRYRIRNTDSLAGIFGKFEANKSRVYIQDYSVGQTTLEQIFNQFAASQDNPEVAAAGGGRNSVNRSSFQINASESDASKRGSAAEVPRPPSQSGFSRKSSNSVFT